MSCHCCIILDLGRFSTATLATKQHQRWSAPEMVKTRPVVVVSRKHKSLCTVVPLSGTRPEPVEPWNHLLIHVPSFLIQQDWWVKCDCITTVALFRLDRAKTGKCPNTGKRLYETQVASGADIAAIRKAILSHVIIGA